MNLELSDTEGFFEFLILLFFIFTLTNEDL